ncbi:MAG: hypothetical protein M0C28_11700 [Candidatus Moduliflexus flocculans]|nr:hypothetical protein [Candidatus Moduliflexus flocculans]
MAQTLERLAEAIETERGLLHALIYTPEEETLGRLTRNKLDRADALLKDVKDGPGDAARADLRSRRGGTPRQARTDKRNGWTRLWGSLQDGKGLVPSLLSDPERVKVLDDLQAAAAGLRALTEDLPAVVARLRQGEGTIGALLEDPTVYEDLLRAPARRQPQPDPPQPDPLHAG